MKRSTPSRRATQFLNVDLDVEASEGRDVLIEELGRRMFQMHRDSVEASFETLSMTKTLDATLLALARTIGKLGPRSMRAWKAAKRRDFNIGIQAGTSLKAVELPVEAKTLEKIAKLGGRIVITVYPSSRSKQRRQ